MGTTTFVDISDEFIETMIGYMASVFSNVSPLLMVIIGVGLGLMVIYGIIRAIRG